MMTSEMTHWLQQLEAIDEAIAHSLAERDADPEKLAQQLHDRRHYSTRLQRLRSSLMVKHGQRHYQEPNSWFKHSIMKELMLPRRCCSSARVSNLCSCIRNFNR
jgi:hypothetical protein